MFNIINTCLVAFGAYIAYQGLTTWKKQIKGQDEYKLALDIMENSYDLEERLRMARGRLFSVSQNDAKNEELQRNSLYQQHATKVNHMLEANNKLRTLKLRADALWGKPENSDLEELLKLTKSFVIDFETFYEMSWDVPKNRIENKDADEIWVTLHGSFKTNQVDFFWERIQKALTSLETRMRTKIL